MYYDISGFKADVIITHYAQALKASYHWANALNDID